MFGYKKVMVASLHTQQLCHQKTEAKVACKVINIMNGLGVRCPAGSPDHCGKG